MAKTATLSSEKSRGHLLGGLLLLCLGHMFAFALLPGQWYPGWSVYLAVVQFIYVLPLSFFVRRMGWAATWIGLWVGTAATAILPIVLWVGQWMAQGGKLGFAGL